MYNKINSYIQSLYYDSLVSNSFSSIGIKNRLKLFSIEFVMTTETNSDSSSGSFMETVCLTFMDALEKGSFTDAKRLSLFWWELSAEFLLDCLRSSKETKISFWLVLYSLLRGEVKDDD